MSSTPSTSQTWDAPVLVKSPGGGRRVLGCGFCSRGSTVQPQQGEQMAGCSGGAWVVARWRPQGGAALSLVRATPGLGPYR